MSEETKEYIWKLAKKSNESVISLLDMGDENIFHVIHQNFYLIKNAQKSIRILSMQAYFRSSFIRIFRYFVEMDLRICFRIETLMGTFDLRSVFARVHIRAYR